MWRLKLERLHGQSIITPELPKTRSGKIMRRVLKAIVNNDDVGDTSTLANPEILEEIKKKLKVL